MTFKQMSNLKQRLMMSFFAILLLFCIIYFSKNTYFSFVFVMFAILTISFAQLEYYNFAQKKGFFPLKKIGFFFTALYVTLNYLNIYYFQSDIILSLVLLLFLLTLFGCYFVKEKDPFINLAIEIFGFVYLTLPLSFIVNINYFPLVDGRWVLLYLLLITKMTDTGAFFIGKKWGSKKLAPFISPKKSWEGALGGMLCAILTNFIFLIVLKLSFTSPPISLTILDSIWVSATISIFSQFGDLAESLLKRDVGVKDSSHLPGMGGVLDIVDSLIFTSPLVYFLLKFGVFI